MQNTTVKVKQLQVHITQGVIQFSHIKKYIEMTQHALFKCTQKEKQHNSVRS